jgi:hypothetical protein
MGWESGVRMRPSASSSGTPASRVRSLKDFYVLSGWRLSTSAHDRAAAQRSAGNGVQDDAPQMATERGQHEGANGVPSTPALI